MIASMLIVLAVNAPSAVAAQALSPNSIQINWVQAGKTTGFRIERLTFGQNTFQLVGQADQNTRQFVDSNLTPATGYLYRVQSVKGNQRSAFTSAPGYTYTLPDVPGPQADFSISVSPASQTIQAGSTTQFTITVVPLNGFDQPVNLYVTGLPANASSMVAPNPLMSPWTSTLTVTTTSTTPASTFGITVGGNSGALTHSWGVSLIVTLPACGQVIQGQRMLVATATDSQSPIRSVQMLLDNTAFGPPLTTPPYNLAWNTANTANGCHSLAASATDAAGNVGFAPAFTVQVGN